MPPQLPESTFGRAGPSCPLSFLRFWVGVKGRPFGHVVFIQANKQTNKISKQATVRTHKQAQKPANQPASKQTLNHQAMHPLGSQQQAATSAQYVLLARRVVYPHESRPCVRPIVRTFPKHTQGQADKRDALLFVCVFCEDLRVITKAVCVTTGVITLLLVFRHHAAGSLFAGGASMNNSFAKPKPRLTAWNHVHFVLVTPFGLIRGVWLLLAQCFRVGKMHKRDSPNYSESHIVSC